MSGINRSSFREHYDSDSQQVKMRGKLKKLVENITLGHFKLKYREEISNILMQPDFQTCEDSTTSKEILKVNRRYQQDFSKVSKKFESWADERRLTIKKLNHCYKIVKYMKENCSKGKILISSTSFLGSTVSLALSSFGKPWASRILLGAVAVGSLSFFCSLFELYRCQSILEDIYRTLLKDEKFYLALMKEVRYGALNFDDLSPHGVNLKIARYIMQPELMKCSERRTYENLIKDNNFSSQDIKIFFALSNVLRNSEILKDEEILANLRIFSKSMLAEKWWNRLKLKNSSFHLEKQELTSKLKSLIKKIDLLKIPAFWFVAFPFTNNNYVNAIGVAVLNGIVSIDYLCDLGLKIEPKESEILKELGDLILEEYNELQKIYIAINPYD